MSDSVRYRLALGALVALAAACGSPTAPVVVTGTWGGTGASMELGTDGGTIQYACGAGTIDAGWTLSPDGLFSATGVHYFGGGPAPIEGRTPHPATYSGTLRGSHLSLTVTVTDTGATLGPFDMVKNGPTVSEACV